MNVFSESVSWVDVLQVRDAVIDCVAAVRRRETELLTQLRAAFAGDSAVQAFIADRSTIEATLRGLDNTCQLTDIIVRERSVELLLLKDDIAKRMTSLLQTSLAQPPPHMRNSYVRFVRVPADHAFPVGRLDFVDETLSASGDEVGGDGQRPRGDGYDSAEDETKDVGQDGGLVPEVEIKRRKVDSEKENDERSSKRPATTTRDCETMTIESSVKSASTTMDRCVHVVDKLIATSSQLTADRSTLTRLSADICHRSTETDPAVPAGGDIQHISRLSQTAASVFQLRSRYVETEPLPVANKWTSTEQPFQVDKVGLTRTSSLVSSSLL